MSIREVTTEWKIFFIGFGMATILWWVTSKIIFHFKSRELRRAVNKLWISKERSLIDELTRVERMVDDEQKQRGKKTF